MEKKKSGILAINGIFVDGSEGFRSPTSFVNLKGSFDGEEEVGDLGYRWYLVGGSEGFRSPTSFVNLKGVCESLEEVGDLGVAQKGKRAKKKSSRARERKQGNSSDNNSKTDIVAAIVCIAPVANRRTTIDRTVEPRATPQSAFILFAAS